MREENRQMKLTEDNYVEIAENVIKKAPGEERPKRKADSFSDNI